MISRLKRQTKHNAKRPRRFRPRSLRIDTKQAAKQFARAIFADLSEPIIGAPFSPDVWKP